MNYKKILFLCSLLTPLYIFNSQQGQMPQQSPPQNQPSSPPVYVTVHNHNDGAQATNTNLSQHLQTQQNTQTVEIKTQTIQIKHTFNFGVDDAVQKYLPMLNTAYTSSASAFDHYKYHIATGSLFLVYAWTLYHLHYTENMMHNYHAWCNWKSTLPLQHLQLTPIKDLYDQLAIDIQKKYFTITSSTKHLPSVQFWNDIQQECKALKFYIATYKFAKKTCCSKIFGFFYSLQNTEDKLTRLYFIIDLFTAQQVTHNSLT